MEQDPKSSSLALKTAPAMQEVQETRVGSLGQEDPLEKELVTHRSILAWRTPWTEEPDGQWVRGKVLTKKVYEESL